MTTYTTIYIYQSVFTKGLNMNKQDTLENSKKFVEKYGYINTPLIRKYGEEYKLTKSRIQYHFGSISNLKDELNLSSKNYIYQEISKISKEDFIKDFIEFSKKYKPTKVNILKFGQEYGISTTKIKYFFGSKKKMGEELGIKMNSNKYTKEEIIKKLNLIYSKFGSMSKELLESLKGQELYINHKTIVRLWGSFSNMTKELFSDCFIKNSYSYGEVVVSNYLKQNNIEFIKEYINHDLKNINKLRYDFYIPSKNIIIEFHGIQHYEFVKYFHKNPEEFKNRMLRDAMKENYAKENGFKYIVIKYTDINKVEEILNKELS